jgi:hypothetical protein
VGSDFVLRTTLPSRSLQPSEVFNTWEHRIDAILLLTDGVCGEELTVQTNSRNIKDSQWKQQYIKWLVEHLYSVLESLGFTT